jgi:GTP-binding protein HflX
MVSNKIDLIPDADPRIDYDDLQLPIKVSVSAVSGAGLDLLKEAIAARIGGDIIACDITLQPEEGAIRAALYELGVITAEKLLEEGGWRLSVRMRAQDFHKIMHR